MKLTLDDLKTFASNHKVELILCGKCGTFYDGTSSKIYKTEYYSELETSIKACIKIDSSFKNKPFCKIIKFDTNCPVCFREQALMKGIMDTSSALSETTAEVNKEILGCLRAINDEITLLKQGKKGVGSDEQDKQLKKFENKLLDLTEKINSLEKARILKSQNLERRLRREG